MSEVVTNVNGNTNEGEGTLENVSVNADGRMNADGSTKGISAAVLKAVAIITMTIDHFGAIFLMALLNSRGMDRVAAMSTEEAAAWSLNNSWLVLFYYVTRFIGRVGFPLFVFLLVEGFGHTRNKLKHVIRLAIFVIVSEVPFDLGFNGQPLEFGYQNVMLTLLIGFLVMWGMEWFENRQRWTGAAKTFAYPAFFAFGYFAYYMFAKCWIGDMLFYNLNVSFGFFDWTFIIPACVVGLITLSAFIMYFERKDVEMKDKPERFVGITPEIVANRRFAAGYSCYVIILGCLLADLCKTDYSGWGVMVVVLGYLYRKNKDKCGLIINIGLVFANVMELFAFFSLIPIKKYNGTRGRQNKYFFYVYYPLHIFLLWGLSKLLLG